MVTQLELAEKKLDRLKNSFEPSPMAGHPLGQPIHTYKASGRAMMRKMEKHEDKMIKLAQEVKEQEKRVEHLREKEYKKENGLTANYGLKKSVENLEKWQARVERQEFVRDYNKTHKLPVNTPFENEQGNLEFYKASKLKEAKETVKMLMELKEKSEQAENTMSELTQELIESGAVNQWAKKPIYYFVKGLRKVALEIDGNGDFKVSSRYPATTDADHKFLEGLGVNA